MLPSIRKLYGMHYLLVSLSITVVANEADIHHGHPDSIRHLSIKGQYRSRNDKGEKHKSFSKFEDSPEKNSSVKYSLALDQEVYKSSRHEYLKFKSDFGNNLTLCSLHLVADQLFFKNVGHGEVEQTRNTLMRLINETNNVFEHNFKDETIQFTAKNITILQNTDAWNFHDGKADAQMTVEEYLLRISRLDFSTVCLGIAFTFRRFGQTVGATFAKNVVPEGSPLIYCNNRSVSYYCHRVSTNTIVISFLNSQGRLNENQQLMTFVHELGHGLGSTHDDHIGQCRHSHGVGNFIMYPHLSSGVKNSNYLFSERSIKEIMKEIIRKRQMYPFVYSRKAGSYNQQFENQRVQLILPQQSTKRPIVFNRISQLHKKIVHIDLDMAEDEVLDTIQDPDVYLPIIFCVLFATFIAFIICSVSIQYQADDTRDMKAMRHSKMLAAFSIGEYMTKIYRKRIVEINKYYCKKIDEVSHHINVDYIEAIARLRTLFPHVPVKYLEKVVKMSANENVAVKILLTHGYPMRTFHESITQLKKLMKTVTIRYKK